MSKTYIMFARGSGKTRMMTHKMLAEYLAETYNVSLQDAYRIIADVMRNEDQVAAEESCQK